MEPDHASLYPILSHVNPIRTFVPYNQTKYLAQKWTGEYSALTPTQTQYSTLCILQHGSKRQATGSHTVPYVCTAIWEYCTGPQSPPTAGLVSPKHKGNVLLRNVGNYSHLDTE